MVAIFVAFMFLSLIITDFGIHKWNTWQAARSTSRLAGATAFSSERLWQVPEDVHLSDVHTWFRPEPSGGLEIGVDTLISHAVGSVQRIRFPQPGTEVTSGQKLFSLDGNGRSIDIPSTVTGKVVAVNTDLQDQPSLLSSDPYGRGWICRVTPTSLGQVTSKVRFGEQAIAWLESEFGRLSEFLSLQLSPELALGATSQDGGLPACGCLGELDASKLKAFEAQFLNAK